MEPMLRQCFHLFPGFRVLGNLLENIEIDEIDIDAKWVKRKS